MLADMMSFGYTGQQGAGHINDVSVIEKGHGIIITKGYRIRMFDYIVFFCQFRNGVEDKPWVVLIVFNQ